uniref:Sugar phosphate transporter domain-containing protein n=1 Tax=Chlamydomonas euryale TaxID=1486919 RepID=A0A7R9VU54_9CHLO
MSASPGPPTGILNALERTLVYKVFIILVYTGSNISLNMLNKWTLSLYGFRFPLAMSMAHMGFSFCALAPIMALPSFRSLHAVTLRKQWPGVLSIAGFFAVNVGFNNISLLNIPLSLNQVIRASIPVVAAAGSVFIEQKKPSSHEFFSLVVIVAGVAMACWEGQDQAASFYGIALCLIGTVSNGLMMSTIGKLMTEKLDALRLTFYTAPLACVLLLPFYFGMEHHALTQYQATHSTGYISLVLLGCINALVYNLVHVLVIKVTSAVTTTVIGEMKIVLILMLSAGLLDEAGIWTTKMLVGCTTAILGFCLYSHVRLQKSAQPAQQGPLIRGVPDLGGQERSPLMPGGKGTSEA